MALRGTALPRSRTCAGLAVVLLIALLAGGGPLEATAAANRPGLSADPRHPLQNTKTTIRVTLPTAFKRPTVLQRKAGDRWRQVAAKRSQVTGSVSYRARVLRATTYRVRAKSIRRDGKQRPAVTSRARRVMPTLRAELVSHRPDGRPGNGQSSGVSLSGDGRYVVFSTVATDLYPEISGLDLNDNQVYLRDRVTGALTLVSHRQGVLNGAGNGKSLRPVISENGLHVAFSSYADNLVAGDTNGTADIFRWSRLSGFMSKISKAASGLGSNGPSFEAAISEDGNEVAYSSEATNVVAGDDNGVGDVFVWNADEGESFLASEDLTGDVGNARSEGPKLSANGTYVTFSSAASDLIFNDSNGAKDVFRFNRDTGTTALVSRGEVGQADDFSGPAVPSRNGRYVLFASAADNLVPGGTPDNSKTHVFVRDMVDGGTTWISRSRTGGPLNGIALPVAVTDDGDTVVFTSDSNDVVAGDVEPATNDIFEWRRASGRSTLLVRDRQWGFPNQRLFQPSLSADGRFVSFYTAATDLVDDAQGSILDAYVWRR